MNKFDQTRNTTKTDDQDINDRDGDPDQFDKTMDKSKQGFA